MSKGRAGRGFIVVVKHCKCRVAVNLKKFNVKTSYKIDKAEALRGDFVGCRARGKGA